MSTVSKRTRQSKDNGQIPPLEAGDRLSRAEFERRYEAMPDLKKAELIEGVVYVPAPIRVRRHGSPQFDLIGWLASYRAATPGVIGAGNLSVRLARDNAGLYCSKVSPGLWLDPEGLVAGDTQAVLAALARGLASREHAAFVASLNPAEPLP